MSSRWPARTWYVTDETIRAEVATERQELADLLASLQPEQWDAPTLCDGWRVREVVAHTTMPFRISRARLLAELVRARGSFNRMADRCARRDAARLSAGELLASVRDNVAHPWTPPGGGARGALSHEVIHGLDITVGSGLDRQPPPERVALVLAGVRPRQVAFFGADLSGIALQATDIDWSYGTGAPLRGLAQDLLLVLCNRRLPAGRLAGDSAARFSRSQSSP
jgi:uncharacterized protein (TIGR03083 family)